MRILKPLNTLVLPFFPETLCFFHFQKHLLFFHFFIFLDSGKDYLYLGVVQISEIPQNRVLSGCCDPENSGFWK